MALTYGELLEAAALARADTPVRVKLGNGQMRELETAALEWDVETLDTVSPDTGDLDQSHRLVGIILTVE